MTRSKSLIDMALGRGDYAPVKGREFTGGRRGNGNSVKKPKNKGSLTHIAASTGKNTFLSALVISTMYFTDLESKSNNTHYSPQKAENTAYLSK